jgi:transcriptional regulator GlxA family with amidase domain
MRAAVLLFEGVDELDALGPYEVLATARTLGAGLEVRLAARKPGEWVTGAHGARIGVQSRLDDGLDLLVVPGGGWGERAERGVWGEVRRGRLPAALAELHAAGVRMASVCTGAMLLATAGLLRDRPAVTHRSARADLEGAGARWVDARVVDDGDILTAGGITSGIDLGLAVVAGAFGAQLADEVAAELEHPAP